MRQAVLLMNDFVNSAIRDLLAGFERWRAHDGPYSSGNTKDATYSDCCTQMEEYIVDHCGKRFLTSQRTFDQPKKAEYKNPATSERCSGGSNKKGG